MCCFRRFDGAQAMKAKMDVFGKKSMKRVLRNVGAVMRAVSIAGVTVSWVMT